MRYLHVVAFLGVVLCATPAVWGQYGLSGCPDILELPQIESQATLPYSYPSTSAPLDIGPAVQRVSTAAGHLPPDAGYTIHRAAPGVAPAPGPPTARDTSPSDRPPSLGPPRPKGPSVVEQMLEEATYSGAPGSGPDAGCGYDATCAAEECETCVPCGDPCWYASGRWLIMTREKCTRLWTTYESGNEANQLMKSCDAGLRWGNGGEVRFGRRFSAGTWALEGAYWGLEPFVGSSSMTHPNGVSTPLDFASVIYANPAIVELPVALFDGAAEHRLDRQSEVHSLEVDLIRRGLYCGGRGCCDVDWSLGIRYFRFRDDFRFRSLRGGGSWANPADIGIIEDQTINSLIGFQFGCDLNYEFRENLSLLLAPKFGIYGNHMQNRFHAYRADGEAFAPDPLSGVSGSYPVRSNQNVVAFLTQVDLGLDWQINVNWSAFLGYRVVVVADIALADRQVPHYIVDIPEIAAIDYDGELILHGAFAGVTYNF